MPKAARDTHLLTATRPAANALDDEHKARRNDLDTAGVNVWHVAIHSDASSPQPGDTFPSDVAPHVEISFLIAQLDSGALSVVRWTLTGGSDVRLSQTARFPLRTYARAAILAVVDVLEEAGGVAFEQVVAENHAYFNSFDIVAGRLTDPRTREIRTTPKQSHTSNGAHGPDLDRVVEEYRKAIERGSRSPTRDVAQAFDVGRSTASRRLAEARQQGLLGPALRTSAGERRDPPAR